MTKSAYRRIMTVLWHVFMLSLAIIVMYPVLWLVASSLRVGNEVFSNASLWVPNPTLRNYATVLDGIGGVPLSTFFLNTAMIAVLSVIGVVLSSSLSAYAFARVRFVGRRAFFTIMIGTLLLPFHVVIIPQYIVFQRLGLVDTFVPLIIGKYLAADAFFVFLFVQFMRTIPTELDDAARIDGCGHGGIFRWILFPLLRPAIITSSIFAFVWTWNDFLGPLLYLTSPKNYTLSLALRLYTDSTSAANYGAVMAMSILALLPVLLFFVVFQRFLIEGVATQGLKG